MIATLPARVSFLVSRKSGGVGEGRLPVEVMVIHWKRTSQHCRVPNDAPSMLLTSSLQSPLKVNMHIYPKGLRGRRIVAGAVGPLSYLAAVTSTH